MKDVAKVQAVPDGFHSVTPYLVVDDVASVLEFIVQAFGADVTEKMEVPGAGLMHAEVQIGDSRVMLGQARDGYPAMPSMLYLYVEDCDAAFDRAVGAGGAVVREPEDQFYGERSGGVRDPGGNQWWFGTRLEIVSAEEAAKRAGEAT